jgi:P27 family predicted phage terminase small subunit
MGRPQKSARLHHVHGTESKAADLPSGFVAGRPKYPKHLSPDAKKAYKHACALLEARHTLTEGDESMLALYATVYARWIEAKKELAGNLMVKIPLLDSNGQVHFVMRPNPMLKIVTDAEGRLLTIAKTLGLSPVDRERSKQTGINSKEEIVPGSIADLYPHLLEPRKEPIPFVVVAPPEALEDGDA